MRDGRMALIPPAEMTTRFPKAWTHLLKFEEPLRAREQSKDRQGNLVKPFDDEEWYRFGRNQNLDKQHLQKLIVAGTVPAMRVCLDEHGAYALNNVWVNGIITAQDIDPFYLLAILNSRIVDFVFRRIAKPKDGGWFEANKQFIAPLPIPDAGAEERTAIAASARRLQTLHSERRDLLQRLERRLDAANRKTRPDSWLFPGLARGDKADLERRLAAIGARLHAKAVLSAQLSHGELRFLADGVPVIERVFVDPNEANFLLAQWRHIAATFNPEAANAARNLSKALRNLAPATTDNAAHAQQVIEATAALDRCGADIATAETAMEDRIAGLYCLTDADRRLVDGRPRSSQ